MTECFTDMHGKVAMSVKLIPGMMTVMPSVSDFEFFEDDVKSMDLLETELHQCFRKWKDQTEKPRAIELTLVECDERFYPNIKTILRICGCFPVTRCAGERSIKNFRLLKTYLRSTIGQERLSRGGLALMYIHRDFEVNIRDNCREFARRKPRRMMLPDILICSEDQI